MINMELARKKSLSLLSERSIPAHPYLPLLEMTSLKSPFEVGQKIVTLYSLAGLANGADGRLVKEWLIAENCWGFLSDAEKSMFSSVNLSREELNELSWKQESLYALCWCVSIIDNMTWPSVEADLSEVFSHIPPEVSVSSFVGSLVLKKEKDIVQMLDLYYCLHASAIHPELWERGEVSSQLKIEVILERRHALEWVFSKTIQWDDITLDT